LRDYQAGDDSRAIHWKTSARQSRLIVRETEAEDQRRVTLALPLHAPDSAAPAFERAVVLIASLAAYFKEQGFAIRLLLGDEELPYGMGETHLYRMYRLLALCRSVPDEQAPLPDVLLTLNELSGPGEFTVLVMSWPDPRLASARQSAGRVIEAYGEWQ
jgi:uncharacterized protein (DUF58 family)